MTGISVTDDPSARRRRSAAGSRSASASPIPPEELLDSPHIFIGTVDDFVAKFTRLRDELGITSIMVGAVGEMDAVVERLAGT